MKISIDDDYSFILEEVYNGVLLKTSEGNEIAVCMRDDTFEINVLPEGKHTGNWWRVNMQTGKMESHQIQNFIPEKKTPVNEKINNLIDSAEQILLAEIKGYENDKDIDPNKLNNVIDKLWELQKNVNKYCLSGVE